MYVFLSLFSTEKMLTRKTEEKNACSETSWQSSARKMGWGKKINPCCSPYLVALLLMAAFFCCCLTRGTSGFQPLFMMHLKGHLALNGTLHTWAWIWLVSSSCYCECFFGKHYIIFWHSITFFSVTLHPFPAPDSLQVTKPQVYLSIWDNGLAAGSCATPTNSESQDIQAACTSFLPQLGMHY